GASFPLALAAVASHDEDPGKLVGGLYAANTIGAIAGSILFSMLLIPALGTPGAQRVLIMMAAVSALVVLLPTRPKPMGVAALAVSVALAGALAWRVSRVPFNVYGYGRQALTTTGNSEELYLGEGMNSSVAISRWDDGARFFHVSGKV